MDPARPWRASSPVSASGKFVRVSVSLAYMGCIYAFSSIPGSKVPLVVNDHLAHFLEYSGLALALLFTVAGFRPLSAAPAAATWLFAALFGATDEWHQMSVAGREAALDDLVFDALGAAAGVIAVMTLLARRRSRA